MASVAVACSVGCNTTYCWLQLSGKLVAAPPRCQFQQNDGVSLLLWSSRMQPVLVFLEKEDDPRPMHLGEAYGHFINYTNKTLKSNIRVRLKPLSKQQTVATPIQLMRGRR